MPDRAEIPFFNIWVGKKRKKARIEFALTEL